VSIISPPSAKQPALAGLQRRVTPRRCQGKMSRTLFEELVLKKVSREGWGVTRFGAAKYTPDLFLVIGSVSVTLNMNEWRPRYE